MKRIDRYLLLESLPPLLFGLVLYSSLAVVSVTLPRMQWIVGTPIARLLGWLALQMPVALVQTLPIALVLTVLLVFGRLATDNELLAMQAGAVPLRRGAITFVIFGLVATLGALALNQWVLPHTNARVAREYWQLTAGSSGLFRLAGRDVPVDDFTLRFRTVDRAADALVDVRVEKWDGEVLTLLRATQGTFEGHDLVLHGYDVTVLDFSALDKVEGDAQQVLGKLVRVINRPTNAESTLTLTTSLTEDDLIARFSGGGFEDSRSLSQTWRDAHDRKLDYKTRRQAAVLFQRQIAEPFANLTLLLVALPLSLAYARSRSVAFGLSLVVTLVWYLLLTFGQLFSQTGVLPVWLGPWLGNAVLGVLGIALLARRVSVR